MFIAFKIVDLGQTIINKEKIYEGLPINIALYEYIAISKRSHILRKTSRMFVMTTGLWYQVEGKRGNWETNRETRCSGRGKLYIKENLIN
jgi:hypothetical protein